MSSEIQRGELRTNVFSLPLKMDVSLNYFDLLKTTLIIRLPNHKRNQKRKQHVQYKL